MRLLLLLLLVLLVLVRLMVAACLAGSLLSGASSARSCRSRGSSVGGRKRVGVSGGRDHSIGGGTPVAEVGRLEHWTARALAALRRLLRGRLLR